MHAQRHKNILNSQRTIFTNTHAHTLFPTLWLTYTVQSHLLMLAPPVGSHKYTFSFTESLLAKQYKGSLDTLLSLSTETGITDMMSIFGFKKSLVIFVSDVIWEIV